MKEKPNLIIWRDVLGEKEKEVKLKQWRNTSGAYKIASDGDITTQMVRGSLLFSDLDKINFIKIDVEGSELPIIEDMRTLILEHKPMILIETGFIKEVLDILTGYKIKDQCLNDYLLIKGE
jgi:FkbM family methyltransferase